MKYYILLLLMSSNVYAKIDDETVGQIFQAWLVIFPLYVGFLLISSLRRNKNKEKKKK